MCNNNSDCKCIGDIIKVINILQKKAECKEECNNCCDRPVLGHECCCLCNTRPVQLILCGQNGDDPLVMPTTNGPITPATCFSNVFRVEKIDDCCACFRVLVKKHHGDLDGDCEEFVATDSFFTVDLKCVCVIKCLEDTFVDCV